MLENEKSVKVGQFQSEENPSVEQPGEAEVGEVLMISAPFEVGFPAPILVNGSSQEALVEPVAALDARPPSVAVAFSVVVFDRDVLADQPEGRLRARMVGQADAIPPLGAIKTGIDVVFDPMITGVSRSREFRAERLVNPVPDALVQFIPKIRSRPRVEQRMPRVRTWIVIKPQPPHGILSILIRPPMDTAFAPEIQKVRDWPLGADDCRVAVGALSQSKSVHVAFAALRADDFGF